MEFSHTSVLFEETIASLLIRPDGIYVDGTLGGGGHSAGILRSLSASGVLIGIDRDDAAIKAAGERLQAASGSRPQPAGSIRKRTAATARASGWT